MAAAFAQRGEDELRISRSSFVDLSSDNSPASRPSTSQLWEAETSQGDDVHRLHLRSLEAILSPTTSAAEIMNAVAFAMSSQGLRLVERDSLRIAAHRIEAAYLPNQPREEWRVVEATLGVSKGGASWVILLEFKTDPCPKQSRGVAVISSLTERISGSSSSSSSLSAAAIAHLRSNRRAEALVEAVAGELDRLDCVAAPPPLPSTSRDGAYDESAAVVEEGDNGLTLAPFEGSDMEPEVPGDLSGSTLANADAGTNAEEVRLALHFVEALCARAEEYSRRDAQETWRPLEGTIRRLEDDNAKLRLLLEPRYRALGQAPPTVPTWVDPRGLGTSSGMWPTSRATNSNGVHVAASAIGSSNSRSDGGGGTQRVNEFLQATQLFVVEGAWVKARVIAGGKLDDKVNGEKSGEPPSTVSALSDSHHPHPIPSPTGARAPGTGSSRGDPESSAPAAVPAKAEGSGVTGDGGGGQASSSSGVRGRRSSLVPVVVKALTEVIGGVCEAQEEYVLKTCLPSAQAYVAELERYGLDIAGGKALRAAPRCSGDGGQGERVMVKVDDELFRVFGAVEIRLYSSSAALGKKPGRLYVTYSTLWFHSKVLGFESRYVLSLAEVESVTLLGTALDLSSSLVISTKRGGEAMLVFPGQRMATLEPLEVLVRHLAAVAAKEASDNT